MEENYFNWNTGYQERIKRPGKSTWVFLINIYICVCVCVYTNKQWQFKIKVIIMSCTGQNMWKQSGQEGSKWSQSTEINLHLSESDEVTNLMQTVIVKNVHFNI